MLLGQKLGSYSLEKELGNGAMGTVYRARNDKTGQRVAIKVLSAGLGQNKKARERFEREIGVLSQLNHPNIVHYINHGRYEGTEYVAMEYVDGETLDSAMQRRGGRFPWEEVVGIGRQVCAALQHAHHEGIIHRDLKPSNIMITRDGVAKLADFGIAKDLDQAQLTSAHCTVGTAAYMSPEQCKGEKHLSHRSDLYSLGIVLYELLTGQKPFTAETAMEMFMQHTQGEFERPGRLVLDIPVWLDNLVCQLLAKKPEERGFDAAVIGEALGRVVEKVSAQDSAGVAAAKTRIGDRALERTRIGDAQDQTAARVLRTTTQARRRRREKAVWHKTWFQACAFSAGLLALGFILFTVFKPASDEQLMAEARALLETNDPDNRAKARTGPIEKFLARHPEPKDDLSRQMHEWADAIDREEMIHAWNKRLRMSINPDVGEQAYRNALRGEDEGNLIQALNAWTALEQLAAETPRETKIRQQFAAERKKDVVEAQDLDKKVKDLVVPGKVNSPVETLAHLADRYEAFGDKANAQARWLEVRSLAPKRSWTLLATKRTRELRPLPQDTLKVRLKLIQDTLKQAQELSDRDPQRARTLCEDLRDLYGQDGEPAVREWMKKADELWKKLRAV